MIAAGGASGDLGVAAAPLFEHGVARFLRDMGSGLRADARTILRIRTLRYSLVGVAALLFSLTAVAAWLPQFYERQLYVTNGRSEALFALLALVGGVPGVLVGGRVADRYAPRFSGGRLAVAAVCLFLGATFTTVSFTIRSDTFDGTAVAGVFLLQLTGFFFATMALPGLRAGVTDTVPVHLRGAGFGAFNLVAALAGQAAAPVIVGAFSSAFGENLRVAFLAVAPLSFIGAAILFRARRFVEEDTGRILEAVLLAIQDQQQRAADLEGAEGPPPNMQA